MAAPIRLVRRFTVPMPADRFFETATMTDRVQQLAGLPPAQVRPAPAPNGRAAMRFDVRMAGFPTHWYDLPFEWRVNRFWRSRSLFEQGPLSWTRVTVTLDPRAADSTEVTLEAEVMPSSAAMRPLAALIFRAFTVPRLVRIYQTFGSRYAEQAPAVFPPIRRPEVDTRVLARRARDLSLGPGTAPLIEHLRDHLATAPDDEVTRMRPFVLAARWGTDRMDTLRLFLYATQAGLLDLHWDILCPNCRVPKATFSSLADLAGNAHCDVCNIQYDVNFDEYVELRFTVNAAVRTVHDGIYCLGGPYRTRHILAQCDIVPGESVTLPLDFPPGRYRWRIRPGTARGLVQIDPAQSAQSVAYRFTAEGVLGPAEDQALAPASALQFENTTDQTLILMLERADWDREGVSAALVTALQEFRTMFSSQVLAPGLGVGIRNLTILFSDLKDSTALYDSWGDTSAYARVRDHFGIMEGIIRRHNGGIVKTMGDAVMAVFPVAGDAVAACQAIQRAMAAYNATVPPAEALCVKLGLHSGPCIAITANDLLDYFGSTVNIAARVQGISQGDDLVFTAAVHDDPTVQPLLAGQPVATFTAQFKGLAQVFDLYRWRNATDP